MKIFLFSNAHITSKINKNYVKKIFFIEKRERKYIPFYDIKKEKKKRQKTEETENKDDGEKQKKKVFFTNLVPTISPMKGLKLLFSFKNNNEILLDKNEKINFNLIIRIDIKRESLRGMCNLIHSVDKNKKILVLVDEENKNLKKYGADYVGLEYINKIKNGWLDFNICITNFKNINKILPIAKILGPKKLMPNIKSDTLVDNLEETIKKIKSGNRIEYRSEQVDTNTFELYNQIYNFEYVDLNSIANINVNIATMDMNFYHILDNIKSFVTEIIKNNVHSSHNEKVNKPTFTWPPITSKKKKKLQLQSNLFNKSEENSESFLLGAYITFNGFPKIFLKPNLLYPHSDGYSN
ncbi:50S ribosomal protein L1, mitochondrial, putative [Plasmodium relictum]|uniref:50S ribosomal protein L1, mitochondrial, putative n=1 Tax=Plasmodium relictum TaxID=85471 RepID=A0A1J1H0E4_PLARL|nr:50S ribosomal protein L1, mitochondrial, putative [Plasmodium relictum]CRG98439.1 50S ribosomal protein L1, mitochondrial, putative [Plasmodium relictum]